MQETYEFGNHTYSAEQLQEMPIDDLLKLRNDVASALGAKSIVEFKSQEAGVDATIKALDRYHAKGERERKAVAEREAREQNRPTAKCALPMIVERPTRNMFRTIRKLCDHPGEGYRVRRWDNYKDGQTLIDIMEGEDMTHLDVHYYVQHELMELVEPTDVEYEARLAAWCEKRGVENPIEAKRKAAEAREQKKAERKAAEAESKKAKEEVKKEPKAKKAKKAEKAAPEGEAQAA